MTVKQDKAIKHLIIASIQVILGVYSCLINTNYIDTYNLTDVFICAKNGGSFELENCVFSLSFVLNMLNVIISIILVSLFVSKDYKSKCYYFATRYGKFNKYFFRVFISCIALCVFNEMAYDLGIITTALLKFSGISFSLDKLFLISIINSIIIITVFSMLGAFVSLLFSEKMGILVSVTLFVVAVILVVSLPVELKQYDIVAWYYAKDFAMNKDIFTYKRLCYYIAGLMMIIIEYFASRRLLRKDIL